ncbi:endoribonuclease CG2145-like [Neocloeon triangulifer]|uniref:endoribonuclease CG2145-like n=1 Tax=Neocloeon triangulifer TaxID=2078957 RepID=UPI00286F3416|nr:endoribonuclease CG2145-like [Neocloeon triangulifer]
MDLSCLLFLVLSSAAFGQEATQTQSPPRSYAQAALPKQPAGNNNAANASVLSQPSPTQFSYAQAARGATPSSPAEQTTQRSYAQASRNQNDPSSTLRPRISSSSPSRGGNTQNRGTSPTSSNVADDELRTFSEELLRSDSNNAAALVRANWQGRTYGSNTADLAPQPLLAVQARALQGATTSKLKLLYDNYEPDAGNAEVVTAYERDEDRAFLDAVMATQVMAKTKKFLVDKGLIENAPGSLKTKLQQLWFTMFPRLGSGSPIGSSAFEHIFLSEVRKGEISGFHNWLYFAHEESTGKANYLGHIRHIDLGGRGSVVKHHFTWGNITKPVGSMFIGTSPELEMALYTVCFMTRPDNKCPVRLGGEPFFIKTHSFTFRGNKYIGSAFPDI